MGESFHYDLFISYAQADALWVEKYLLPALNHSSRRIITSHDYLPGAPTASEIERVVTDSRYILLVLSPQYLNDPWTRFGEQLTAYANIS